jgi:hypothetical protein
MAEPVDSNGRLTGNYTNAFTRRIVRQTSSSYKPHANTARRGGKVVTGGVETRNSKNGK